MSAAFKKKSDSVTLRHKYTRLYIMVFNSVKNDVIIIDICITFLGRWTQKSQLKFCPSLKFCAILLFVVVTCKVLL